LSKIQDFRNQINERAPFVQLLLSFYKLSNGKDHYFSFFRLGLEKNAIYGWTLTSCGGQSSDPGLEKAAQVIQYMMVPRNLSRSAFSVAFTDPKPSNFVSYIFSPMGLSYQLF